MGVRFGAGGVLRGVAEGSMRFAVLVLLCLGWAMAGAWEARAADAEAATLGAGVTVDEMVDLLKSYPEVESVSVQPGRFGNPALSARSAGIDFDVFFYHCDEEGDSRCGEVQYKATFVPEQGRARDAAKAVARWDQDWVFGRAFVEDDLDVVIEHAHFARGVTRLYLEQNAELWLLSILPDFRRAIGY